MISAEQAKDELADHASFHSLGGHDVGADILDPEMGTARYAERKSAARAIKKQMKTTFGQLLIWLSVMLISGGTLIVGLSSQHWITVGIAAVFAIPAWFILRSKYNRWKQNRKYLIRLCETLGENIEVI